MTSEASPAAPGGAAGKPSRGRLANETWEALLRGHTLLMREFAAEPIWGEVSMREYDVLYTLAKHADPQRATILRRDVLLSQPALSRLIERLVTRGLVSRTPDPADGRASLVGLTEEGHRIQRQVGGRHAAHVAREMTARLNTAEQEALGELLRRMTAPECDPISTEEDPS